MRSHTFTFAIVALVVVSMGLAGSVFLHRQRDDRPVQELMAAFATQPVRAVEGRVSEAMRYAPPPVQTRGALDADVSPEVRIAAATIEKQARSGATPRSTAALGLAYLALHWWTRAVDALEDAAQSDVATAALKNDLSVAYLARAAAESRPEDWANALAAAGRAVSLDPRRPEPYFNRALALRGLHLTYEEAAAWRAYVQLDPSGPWTNEARQHLAEAESSPVNAGGSLDLGPVRQRIEDDLLPRWAAAYESGRSAEAASLLADADALANQLAGSGGDAMPRDEVSLVRRAAANQSHSTLLALAAGHRLFGEARQRFVANDIVAAARLMSTASESFVRADSPYRHWAAIYDAIATRNDGRSDAALERLAVVPVLPETYYYLQVRVAWTEALARGSLGRYDIARDLLVRALAELRTAHEPESAIPVLTILAETEWYLGNRERAWATVREVLSQVDDRAPTTRVQHLDLAATMAIGAGVPEAALAFQEALIRLAPSETIRTEAYLRRARTYVRLRDAAAAAHDVSRALDSLPASLDAAQRDRIQADVAAVRADLLAESDCGGAIRESDAALAYYNRVAGTMRRVGVLTVRARCRALLGDVAGARADLLSAVQFFEDRRSGIASAADRLQAFELERRAFSDLIELESSRRHDDAAAFAAAERSRAGVIAETWNARASRNPPGTSVPEGVAVVYYEPLPDRVLVWVVTRRQRVALQAHLTEAALARMVTRIRRAIQDGADLASLRPVTAEFSTRLIGPALALADRDGFKATVVFVPGGALYAVPFGALPDAAGRALIEQRTILLAPNLRTFAAASASLVGFHAQSVVAVGDGHDPSATGLPMLPHADAEASMVAASYPVSTVLAGPDATKGRFLQSRGDVLHFAGHSVLDERYPMLSRLLLAPDMADGDLGWLIEADITPRHFAATRVVMLATCESAAGPPVQGEGAISLARAFFAAGVPAVVASLWPVDDDLQTLVTNFHRVLREEGNPAKALRVGQLALLEERGRHAPVRVWGGFIMLGGVTPAGR